MYLPDPRRNVGHAARNLAIKSD